MQYLDDIISRSKIAEGSLETFDALYLRYFSLVEGFAFAMLKDQLAAQDVCQTVFMKLWERRAEMKEIESVSSYLFTMTRNEIFKIFNIRFSIFDRTFASRETIKRGSNPICALSTFLRRKA